MRPRLLFRTHYQVDEPAYMAAVVRKCSSPVQGAYKEVIAKKLVAETQKWGRQLNAPACGYAVDLAKALGLLTEQRSWSERAHLLSLVTPEEPCKVQDPFSLDERQRLAYFRLFLEADGAAILFMGRQAMEHGQLPYEGCNWNSLSSQMFVETYSHYLPLASDIADRVSLRNDIERIRGHEYKGKTGAHKAFIHLQTMHRLGLLKRQDVGNARVYRMPPSAEVGGASLVRLVSELESPAVLDKAVRSGSWADLAARVFGYSAAQFDECTPRLGRERVLALVVQVYSEVMQTGVPLCPLSTLMDAVQVEMLVQRSVLVTQQRVLGWLERERESHPRAVRFHVDRQGRPAYVRLSEEIVEGLSGR